MMMPSTIFEFEKYLNQLPIPLKKAMIEFRIGSQVLPVIQSQESNKFVKNAIHWQWVMNPTCYLNAQYLTISEIYLSQTLHRSITGLHY
jgi:hypothetical protein